MNTWKINGPAKLSGKVDIKGNKNSALPCITASLLLKKNQVLALENVPKIKDVETLCGILNHLGIDSKWQDGNILILKPLQSRAAALSPDIVSKIRASILLLGPLIGIFKKFKLPKPGGDKIGTRPLSAHVTAFQDLGFNIKEDEKYLNIDNSKFTVLKDRKIKVWLTEKSVTTTANLLLFSPSLKPVQELTIFGAACEPHINTLCNLLVKLGANIQGSGSNHVSVSWPGGIKDFKSKFCVDDDFMEAATYAVAAAITRSNLNIKFKNADDLKLIDRYMKWLGVNTNLNRNSGIWNIYGSKSSLKINPQLKVIKAEPWPGFPTDIMSLFAVLATQCKGTVKFLEYMYDDRFSFVQLLKDMGANIEENFPHVIKIHGPTKLSGLETFIRPDIRSGAAMLIAALAAEGVTTLHDKNQVIERGYEKLPETLSALGASIKNGE